MMSMALGERTQLESARQHGGLLTLPASKQAQGGGVTAAAGMAAPRPTEAAGAGGARPRCLRHLRSPGRSPADPERSR